MKKVFIAGLLIVNLIVLVSCSDTLHTEQPYNVNDKITAEETRNLKTFKSDDGWEISYPSTWNKVESKFIQEEASGKTLVFNSEDTTKEDLERWLDKEIKRKLEGTEGSNTLKEDLNVKRERELWYYTYTISSKIESSESLLKTTVIFDGKRKYEFWADLSKVTEEEYNDIISSFKVKAL